MKLYVSIKIPMYDVDCNIISRDIVVWNDFNHVVVEVDSETITFSHRRYEYRTDKGLIFSANQVHLTLADAMDHVFEHPHEHPHGTWDNPWYLPGMQTC